jgi:hypothetical protein
MRVRTFIAAAVIAVLAGPALAQQPAMQRYGEKDKEKTTNQLQEERDAERAYKRSLDAVPEKGPVDPWGNARTVGEPKTDTKAAAKTVPAKPKIKTGETAK